MLYAIHDRSAAIIREIFKKARGFSLALSTGMFSQRCKALVDQSYNVHNIDGALKRCHWRYQLLLPKPMQRAMKMLPIMNNREISYTINYWLLHGITLIALQ